MREIKYIVVHTTASNVNASIESIKRYWKDVLKWNNVGYHCIIDRVGNKHYLSDLKKPTNGVAGYNSSSVHVSYIGGIDATGKPLDNRTDAQKQALIEVLKEWRELFPKAQILGHRDFPNVKKACPCFNAKEEYKNI